MMRVRYRRATVAILVMLWWVAKGSAAQDAIFWVDGPEELLGLRALDACGDVDRDGTPDILVGTPSNYGFVQVISGRDQHVIYHYRGEIWGYGYGWSLAGLGDFDGDGVPDFCVGEPKRSQDAIEDGRVLVYRGVHGTVLVTLQGFSEGEQLGRTVAGIGDVNGDGYDDLAAAGFRDLVRIHLGPGGALLRTHTDTGTRAAVAGVGDMDRDGYADYVIGWPQDSTQGTWTGRATVFSGRDGAPIHTVYGETPQQGNLTGDHLGLSVSGAGDVNGDGVADFLAGAPGEIDVTFGANHGMVRLYSGLDGSLLLQLDASTESDYWSQFGHRVSGGVDVNADGVPDLVVGAPNEGSLQGSVSVFSGRTGQMLWKQTTAVAGARLGGYLAVVADKDTDGLGDFAIGDGDADENGQNSGRVTVYAGALGDAERYCSAAPNSTGPGAVLELGGPISVGDNLLRLLVSGAVPGEVGLAFYGPEATEDPFGDGYLCVGGGLFRLGPPQTVAPDGTDERPLDFTQPPLNAGAGGIDPGETWSFQFWYRDPLGPGGSGFNLSDALRIQFLP